MAGLLELALSTGLALTPVEKMVDNSASRHRVDPFILLSIVVTEGGKDCQVEENSDGSLDLGRAQINTIHSKALERMGLRLIDVACNPELNIDVAAWHLRNKLNETGGDIWRAAGRYHSKTAVYALAYLKRLTKVYQKVTKDIIGRAERA